MVSKDGGEEEMERRLDLLPAALQGSIMLKLDLGSICCLGATCKTIKTCSSQILTFIPSFHLQDVALPVESLRPLLPLNPSLTSLKLDCNRLDDAAVSVLIQPSLQELYLQNCDGFSGVLLSEIGGRCKDLRVLYLESVGEKRGRKIYEHDLEALLLGCTQLDSLMLMFDVSLIHFTKCAEIWALASRKLTFLEIGHIASTTVIELLTRNNVLLNVEKLRLSVDIITDFLLTMISKGLLSLTHLDLRDAPLTEPRPSFDLTNSGLQEINQRGKLKHLSLVRSQEYCLSSFRRVNDLGMLLLADKCANIESICLGGFSRVTDTGFKTILHSCSNLYKFRVYCGSQLTDLIFHELDATSLSLTHVSLRWCRLLTHSSVQNLAFNLDLEVLDLRECKNLGDEALRAIRHLTKLKVLLIDGANVTDAGLLYLCPRIIGSLTSLSLRSCRKLTDKCIAILFDGSSKLVLRELDLSNLPHLTDTGLLTLARGGAPLTELRLRQCPRVGDTSVMALASTRVGDDECPGSSLRILDIFNCGGITPLAFKWLKKPYFPNLRKIGVTGSVNRDIVDALARNRPSLNVICRGEELGDGHDSDGAYVHVYDEVDEMEEWLEAGETDDEDMWMEDIDQVMSD